MQNTKYAESGSMLNDEIDIKIFILNLEDIWIRNKFIIVTFSIIGLLFGLSIFLTTKPIYESNMVVNTQIIDLPTSNSLILTLEDLMEEGNYAQLSKNLNIDMAVSKSLKQIKVENIYEKSNEEEIEIFRITVAIDNTDILPALQKGIIYYLEQNPFVKKRVDIKKDKINAQIVYLNNKLKEVEELRSRIANGNLLQDQNNNTVLFNPISIYSQAKVFFEQELDLQGNLQLAENFHVVQGFPIFQKPVNQTFSKYLLYGFILSITASFVVIFVLEFRRYMKKLKIQNV